MQCIVLSAAYAWRTPIEGTSPVRYDHHRAYAGQVIDVSDAEFQRTSSYGYLQPVPQALAATVEESGAGDPPIDEDVVRRTGDPAAAEAPVDTAGLGAQGVADVDPAVPDTLVGDEVLNTYNAAELVAYVGQHPDEADRVWRLELARGGRPRVTVAQATGHEDEA